MPTRDLGRSESAPVRERSRELGLKHRIRGIRSAYWREGYIAERFPGPDACFRLRRKLCMGRSLSSLPFGDMRQREFAGDASPAEHPSSLDGNDNNGCERALAKSVPLPTKERAVMNYSAKAPSSSFQSFPGDEAKSTPLARKRRIGFFGFFGSGNSGNDGSLETMLRRVREAFPDAEILCVCAEPAKVGPRLAVNCVRINWRPQSAALQKLDRWLFNIPREIATLIHGVRHLRKLDALIIPGTGILDDFCTGPRGMPYWLFRWSLLARLTGTRVAFVSIGAGPIHHPLSRWLMKKAAGMASYRSYRDRYSLEYMRDIGSNVVPTRVFPDLHSLCRNR